MSSLTLKCLSLNVKGLNLPEKRSQVLSSLTTHRAHFIFLQETHFRSDAIPKLSNHIYRTAFHSTNPESKTKGVSILVSKNANFQISDSLVDPDGRYIFLKGSYASTPITLANIYCPNDHQVSFFRKTCDLLTSFKSGIVLLGGDFNVPLNPLLDSSTGTSTLTYKAIRQINLQLQSLTLHDTWRTLFPSDKDYTFFSAPHQKYSRIDFFFLSQTDLPLLQQSTIEPMFLSDHHPITVTLSFPEPNSRTKIWRLNPSLLKDPLVIDHVRTRIQQYFTENSNPEISPTSLWEAHKCVIRGELIALATKAKKQRQEYINSLIRTIGSLETSHKLTHARATLQELTHTRALLLEELGKRSRRRYILGQRIFYEQGNKCGRLLARTVQNSKLSSTIHHLRNPRGELLNMNADIAKEFERFYQKLYNLQPTNTPRNNTDSRTANIRVSLQLQP